MRDCKIPLEFTKDEFIWLLWVLHSRTYQVEKQLKDSPPEKDVHILRGNYHLSKRLTDKLLTIFKLEVEGYCDDE